MIPRASARMVGLIPLFAVEVLDDNVIERLPGFRKRLQWFLENRQDLAQHISYMQTEGRDAGHGHRLLAIPSRDRLERVLRYLLDENEFLSPYGIRSLSRFHKDHPYVCSAGGQENRVAYEPGESDSGMFGGNSNWRGPVWFPVNYLLIEALERYHHFYGDTLRVECPTGSGRLMNLAEVARELAARLTRIFLPDAQGRRPCHGSERPFRRRSALAGPDPLSRVLSRRQRPRARGEPPDRLDGPGNPSPGGGGVTSARLPTCATPSTGYRGPSHLARARSLPLCRQTIAKAPDQTGRLAADART